MSTTAVRLDSFTNSWYRPGRGRLTQAAWFFVGLPLLRSSILPSSTVRRALLRAFGASIGTGVVIKPGVRVKYPWLLKVGDYSWIGEDAWIDNLAPVTIGRNVCVSQGAYFCTGNHDWADPAFGLVVRPIQVHDGAWVGAKAVLAPGVSIGPLAVVSAGGVITKDVPASEIHGGNPAKFIRVRVVRE